MKIIGISAFYHDSAVALIENGKVLWAAEEERFSRIKHDNNFPYLALKRCLKDNNLKAEDINYVSYYEKPLLKFERILENFVITFPWSLKFFLDGIPEWINQKIKVEAIIKKEFGEIPIFFIPHHLSHAAASYFFSPYKNAAILTADGVGEYETTVLWSAKQGKITRHKSLNFPHSLGLLYSTFTSFLGFKVNEDEYKVMGLSAYGKPIYVDNILDLIDLKEDGSFEIKIDYFGFPYQSKMWNRKFEKKLGQPRKINEPILKKHKDIAASIQKVTEMILFKILNNLYQTVQVKNLCLSGGIALNALANGKIFDKTPFKNVSIIGAAGDSGSAIGCALFIYHSVFKKNFTPSQTNLFLGSSFSDSEIEQILKRRKIPFTQYSSRRQLTDQVALLLEQQQIIGWCQGKMEFGPRALGHRSILASPRSLNMKDKVNLVKRRELFRPFAGAILKSSAKFFFDLPSQVDYPYMNFCFQVKPNMQKFIPAIVHKDGSCRIQTVTANDGIFYELLKKFQSVSGIPCLLNTSFNIKGEPIVETPEQALDDYLNSPMDCLVLNNFLIHK